MDVLAVESLQAIIIAANAIILSTILGCYGLAVGLGHVPAWLPMISDCAVEAPERYPFRMGLVIGSFLLGFEVIAVYNSDRKFSKDKVCLYLGCIASFCLGVVGVVNEKEDNTIHSTAAVFAFVLYDVYMVIMAWNVTLDPDSPKWSIYVKQGCAMVCSAALIAFAFLSMNWGKYHIYIALMEWTGTMCILLFQVSFSADLNYIACVEVSYKKAAMSGGDSEDEESAEPEVDTLPEKIPM